MDKGNKSDREFDHAGRVQSLERDKTGEKLRQAPGIRRNSKHSRPWAHDGSVHVPSINSSHFDPMMFSFRPTFVFGAKGGGDGLRFGSVGI